MAPNGEAGGRGGEGGQWGVRPGVGGPVAGGGEEMLAMPALG